MKALFPLLLALAGCEGPITNGVFYEDEAFLAALPSAERFAPPQGLGDAPVDDALFLALGQAANDDLQSLLQPLIASGEALRRAIPAERSDVHRAWAPVPVAIEAEGAARIWWVQARVLLPEGAGATWTIERARDRGGPWTVAGAGRHEAGEGALQWEEDGAAFSASYGADEHGRVVEVVEGARGWQLRGPVGLVFSVDDTGLVEEPRPATALLVHGPEGGRAEGWLLAPEGRAGVVECWDAAGARTWLGGDPMIEVQGSEAACAVESLGVAP